MISNFEKTMEPVADIGELLPRFAEDGGWASPVPRLDHVTLTPQQVHQAIHRLPEPYRGVVFLHDAGRVAIPQIAFAIRLETSEVRAILHHGRMAVICLLSRQGIPSTIVQSTSAVGIGCEKLETPE